MIYSISLYSSNISKKSCFQIKRCDISSRKVVFKSEEISSEYHKVKSMGLRKAKSVLEAKLLGAKLQKKKSVHLCYL